MSGFEPAARMIQFWTLWKKIALPGNQQLAPKNCGFRLWNLRNSRGLPPHFHGGVVWCLLQGSLVSLRKNSTRSTEDPFATSFNVAWKSRCVGPEIKVSDGKGALDQGIWAWSACLSSLWHTTLHYTNKIKLFGTKNHLKNNRWLVDLWFY